MAHKAGRRCWWGVASHTLLGVVLVSRPIAFTHTASRHRISFEFESNSHIFIKDRRSVSVMWDLMKQVS